MIFVTGDTHGIKNFPKLLSNDFSSLKKDDYVIICGDCGVLFDKAQSDKIINLYTYLPFTILFVDGNHENFDLLYSFPIVKYKGGKAHKISKSIYHLMRGYIFNIEGVKIFTFGGALSYDKDKRIENVSWWNQEMPTLEEFNEGMRNLKKYGFEVDYVLTHDCNTSLLEEVKSKSSKLQHEGVRIMPINEYLEQFCRVIKYKKWYFGHYHIDINFSNNMVCLYEKIIHLGDDC